MVKIQVIYKIDSRGESKNHSLGLKPLNAKNITKFQFRSSVHLQLTRERRKKSIVVFAGFKVTKTRSTVREYGANFLDVLHYTLYQSRGVDTGGATGSSHPPEEFRGGIAHQLHVLGKENHTCKRKDIYILKKNSLRHVFLNRYSLQLYIQW